MMMMMMMKVSVTGVCAFVVLQVSGGGESLAAVLLAADEGFLSVVDPHVNLQPLQHIETLPTTLGSAAERAVVPETHASNRKAQFSFCIDCCSVSSK